MCKINLLKDSNTEILKKTVKLHRDKIKSYERNKGDHFAQFVDFVKLKQPELNETQATKLFKYIESTWTKQAPKMFIVDLLKKFSDKIVKEYDVQDSAQIKIPQA